MFFEIQSAKLEADDRPIEVTAPPPRNLSRRHSHTKIVGNSNSGSVLDQIKRSAGNTPAFKSSERRSINTVNHHKKQMHEYETPNTKDDEDLTHGYDGYEIDLLRQNDTDNGYAGFGVTPFATSHNSDFSKLVSNYSLKTATTADESMYSLQNHTNEFTSFFFDQDTFDDRTDMDNDHTAVESDKKSHVSTNSSRSMNYFTSIHNHSKTNKQQPLPPPSSVASSSTKRFSPFKNIVGPAERMLRLLDGPASTSQPQQPQQNPSIHQHEASVSESPVNHDGHHQIQQWYRDDANTDEATDEEEEDGAFGEPVSLLDLEDNDDDYGDEQEDNDDQTYSDSYTQANTNNGYDDADNESYYDSDDYDDDETLLTMDDEYDEYYEENGSKRHPSDPRAITGVESFLDELAEVEDVRDLGTLLYQVGSCNFQGIIQKSTNQSQNNGMASNNVDYDDEYTVTSDAFPSMKQDLHAMPMVHATQTLPQQQQQQQQQELLEQPHSVLFSLWPQKPNAIISATTQSPQLPVENQEGSRSRHGIKINHPSGQRFIEGTTDTVAQILHSMSISTESLYDIMGTSSNLSQPSATASSSSFTQQQHPATHSHDNNSSTTNDETPSNANQSFFQSIFSCHG